MSILNVKDLYVGFPTADGVVKAVNSIDLCLEEKEILGLLGESGSGKTVFGQAIMRLIKDKIEMHGQILYEGQDVLEMDKRKLRKMRGKKLGMIMQNPGSSLNPSYTIGNQIGEALTVHNKMKKTEVKRQSIKLLEQVKMQNPEKRANEYVHQFSGGMKERAIIAMGIAGNPDFMVVDEPTKGLDTLVKYKVVRLMKEISQDKTMILITHDLDVAQELCTKIAILYLGELVEIAPVDKLFEKQLHPYTQGFFDSMPKRGMIPIEGTPDSLINLPKGCRFHTRCSQCTEHCKNEHPPMYEVEGNRKVRCFLYAGSEPS